MIPSKYVELYFKKLFFYQLLPIAHQVTISNWDKKYLQINNTEIMCKKNPHISNSIFLSFFTNICKKANSFS